ncbi:hypothetical protein JQ621_31685 [Bradyrhizobium manausense]|uniref:hypothetical protein n=1 Tax=Bradyrhizobium manausense TaxID=989370 RepID=UPI001BA4CDA9|nr:hypothetical protein [Bradyrhizobium manausense]MBR1092039.1 hypothetical protein [Bradyrhizobium manausense]
MSRAMELIVAGFVKTRNHRALSDLLTHRRKVLGELQAVTGINPANAVNAVRDEIAIIETGIAELKPPPGSVSENEWG